MAATVISRVFVMGHALQGKSASSVRHGHFLEEPIRNSTHIGTHIPLSERPIRFHLAFVMGWSILSGYALGQHNG